jgi:hypothetical protein
MTSQPREAGQALGLIYPMNNHGWYYYLSATQATQLTMLMYMSMAFCGLAFAVNVPIPKKPPWQKYALTTQLLWGHFLSSLVLSASTLWLTSPYLASVLVSRGIILNPW